MSVISVGEKTGSSVEVAGWISIPLVPSTPDGARERWKKTASGSSDRRSIGDQPPATLPATMPAIAVTGPNTEFELARPRLFDFSGVVGFLFSASASALAAA